MNKKALYVTFGLLMLVTAGAATVSPIGSAMAQEAGEESNTEQFPTPPGIGEGNTSTSNPDTGQGEVGTFMDQVPGEATGATPNSSSNTTSSSSEQSQGAETTATASSRNNTGVNSTQINSLIKEANTAAMNGDLPGAIEALAQAIQTLAGSGDSTSTASNNMIGSGGQTSNNTTSTTTTGTGGNESSSDYRYESPLGGNASTLVEARENEER